MENLDHSLELIPEYWDENHPQSRRPKLPPTTLKLDGNPGKFQQHPIPQTIAQTTSENPMTRRNMILAALSRTISPQMMTPSYGTPTRALRTAKTLE